MKHFAKLSAAMLVLVLLFSVSAFADGSDYFDVVDLWGCYECYEVPEVLSSGDISEDTIFYMPVALYEGYEEFMLEMIYDPWDNGEGIELDLWDAIEEFLDGVHYDSAYYEMCLDEDDASDVEDWWEDVETGYYDYDDEIASAIYNCMYEWSYWYDDAVETIAEFLFSVYQFEGGGSEYEDMDELCDWYADDVNEAIYFLESYFPDWEW